MAQCLIPGARRFPVAAIVTGDTADQLPSRSESLQVEPDLDIADGTGNGRHFREQMVWPELDDEAKDVADAHTGARPICP